MTDIVQGFTAIKGVLKFFSNGKPSKPSRRLPKGIFWGRFVARVTLLVLVLFIFVWWPVDEYTPEGFDQWSTRMKELPQNVWYVLLAVILSWGTVEAVGARNGGFAPGMSPMDMPMGEGAEEMDGPPPGFDPSLDTPMDGRFSNAVESDPLLDGPIEPNPVLEEWRAEHAS